MQLKQKSLLLCVHVDVRMMSESVLLCNIIISLNVMVLARNIFSFFHLIIPC